MLSLLPLPAQRRRSLDRAVGLFAIILLGALGLAVWEPRIFALEQMLYALLPSDANVQEGMLHLSEQQMHVVLIRCELLAMALIAFSAALYYRRGAVIRLLRAKYTFDVAIWAACTASVSVALVSYGHEGEFSPVTALMQHPAHYAITGNRMLMVWVADFLKWAFPPLSYLRGYLLSQVIATGAAMYMMGRWCVTLLGERYRMLAQVVLAVALIPTIIYYTFYDIAMVFFYTLCLMLLYHRRYAFFVLALGLGAMNHENTLLLVVVAAAVLYGTASRQILLLVPSAAFLTWIFVRLLMQYILPIQDHFEMHIWTNLVDISEFSRALIKSAAILVFWWFAAAIGMQYAEQFLRRSFILLPCLISVTFLVGKFIEARQWDAFLPVGIPLILSAVAYCERRRTGRYTLLTEHAQSVAS